jgi:hypothetical protein
MGVPMITIAQARAAGACSDGVERAREHVTWDEDQPVPLTDILKYSMDDALWALFVVDEVRWRHFALDCATRVLPIFEKAVPGDRRVRDCIEFYRANPKRPAADATWAARAAGADWADGADGAADAAGADWAADAAGAARAAEAAAWSADSADSAWAARAARLARAADAAEAAAWAAWAADAAQAAWLDERAWQEERLRKYLGARRPKPLPLPKVA